MKLAFDKIEGCGNDFVLLDQHPDPAWIAPICDRHHGVGADGIMVHTRDSAGNLIVDHYDPDGSRSFCLNGLRSTLNCLSLKDLISDDGEVISEGQALSYQIKKDVCIRLPKRDYQACTWSDGHQELEGYFTDVGNPHVVLLDRVAESEMTKLAPLIRADKQANVHFVTSEAERFHIVSYERGVEGFTLACGSGMLAAALVIMGESNRDQVHFKPQGNGQVTVKVEGETILFSGTSNWVASGVWLC